MLEFISDFGKPTAPLPAAIVACVPKKVHIDGIGDADFAINPQEITDAIAAGLEEPIHPEPEVCYFISYLFFFCGRWVWGLGINCGLIFFP